MRGSWRACCPAPRWKATPAYPTDFRSRRRRPWQRAWPASSDSAAGGFGDAVGCAPQYDRVDSPSRSVLAWRRPMLHCKTILLLCVLGTGCRLDDLYVYPDGQVAQMPPPMEMETEGPALANESQILAF